MARTADKTDIPNRLTKAGRELFSRHGYNSTGIQQITDHAGVPKGSFYNHFESKEAFAAVIVTQYADYLQRSWEAMMEAAPPEPMAAIHYVFTQMIAYHQSRKVQAGCLIGNFAAEIALSSETCRAVLQAAQLAWRERLAGMISQAQADGAIRTDIAPAELSGLVWDVWEGALLRMKLERSVEALRRSVDLMFNHLFQPAATADSAAASQRPTTE
ncbi:TetR/AcrR family transcriptional regulator [Cupriavidus lacunae]|uniref:TetR family transcriptional regulator n=1 Tax=Cupriavidus lacunae TaxID=2666307 RepID=A0A370MVK4_9BURK|nr:TetR/AcrR family transcriptional regulator [Cupriavidus lacunae]RDJ97405.1 TetR family transcriptional regulator [Cupriavidus lacunae]